MRRFRLGLPGPKLEKPDTNTCLAGHVGLKAGHGGFSKKYHVTVATMGFFKRVTKAGQAGRDYINPDTWQP